MSAKKFDLTQHMLGVHRCAATEEERFLNYVLFTTGAIIASNGSCIASRPCGYSGDDFCVEARRLKDLKIEGVGQAHVVWKHKSFVPHLHVEHGSKECPLVAKVPIRTAESYPPVGKFLEVNDDFTVDIILDTSILMKVLKAMGDHEHVLFRITQIESGRGAVHLAPSEGDIEDKGVLMPRVVDGSNFKTPEQKSKDFLESLGQYTKANKKKLEAVDFRLRPDFRDEPLPEPVEIVLDGYLREVFGQVTDLLGKSARAQSKAITLLMNGGKNGSDKQQE